MQSGARCRRLHAVPVGQLAPTGAPRIRCRSRTAANTVTHAPHFSSSPGSCGRPRRRASWAVSVWSAAPESNALRLSRAAVPGPSAELICPGTFNARLQIEPLCVLSACGRSANSPHGPAVPSAPEWPFSPARTPVHGDGCPGDDRIGPADANRSNDLLQEAKQRQDQARVGVSKWSGVSPGSRAMLPTPDARGAASVEYIEKAGGAGVMGSRGIASVGKRHVSAPRRS